MRKKSVMVLDGSSRAALAIVRSLGQKGFEVFVGGNSAYARSFFSKYCRESFVYTESKNIEESRKMHEEILAGVERFKPDVLIPIFSKSVLAVLRYRDEYEHKTRVISFSGYSAYRRLDDKAELTKLAMDSGVAVPETFFPENEEDVCRRAGELEYPVLIKPRVSAGGFGIKQASNPQELCARYRELIRLKERSISLEHFDPTSPIIQHFIQGAGMTAQTYCLKGKAQDMFIGKSLRQCPIPFGSPIAYKSVKHPKVKKIARDFLEKINWEGPVNLTFIEDVRDGIPKLIEVNPRLAGTVESAMASGVDLPLLLVMAALGELSPQTSDYAPGGIFRWVLFGELFYLLFSRRKIKALRELLDFKNCRCEISLRDLKPHLAHFLNLLIRRQGVC